MFSMRKINQVQHRFKAISSMVAMVVSFVSTVQRYRRWWENRTSYTLTLTEKENFFYDVLEWITGQVTEQDRRYMTIKAERTVTAVYDGSTSQVLDFQGHPVKVTVRKPQSFAEALSSDLLGVADVGSKKDHGSRTSYSTHETTIEFIAKDRQGRDAVVATLKEVYDRIYGITSSVGRTPRMHMLGSYQNKVVPVPSRDMSTVILADGQAERIVEDMERFFKSEAEYAKRGLPWHRGYLFHGPPGTGKTSLAKALAHRFGVDLYYYPLGNASSDSTLNGAFREVPARSIILLEDVEVFSGMRDRDEDRATSTKETFSLSALLNVLDGVLTPEGCVIIMTTNNMSKLDHAVVRPGRCDLIEKLDNLQPGQGERMFENFYDCPPSAPLDIQNVPAAFMIEIMRRNMYNPCRGEEQLRVAYKEVLADEFEATTGVLAEG